MLRIFFTENDLTRVRYAARPDFMWETILSITLLGSVHGSGVFGPWRRVARERLSRLPRQHTTLLRKLVPPVGNFPDFLTPRKTSSELAGALDAVLSTPQLRLHADITACTSTPPGLAAIAAGEAGALTQLGDSLHAYFGAALWPYWPRIQRLVDAERASRARILLNKGTEGLLESLGPTTRWNSPVLEVDYPERRDLHLNGRGLTLIPSAFCWRVPVSLMDSTLPPVLVYPLSRTADWWTIDFHARGISSLENLLGRSRARCLNALRNPCTTGDLARSAGISAPAASQHATALREADLIFSTRTGNSILHTLTPLGASLLNSTDSDGR